MSEHVEVNREGHVLVLRLARPEKRNAVTQDMYTALADAIAGAESDRNVRVIVLHGSGGTFSAGNDIKDFLAAPPTGPDSPTIRYLRALARSSVPIVAGVDGDAVGIGVTTLLHCDFVLVTHRARLRFPFVNLGIVPEAGSTLLLPKILGHARAAELMLLAEPFDGARAVTLGIANRLVPPQHLEEEAMAVAGRLVAMPPAAMRETKRLLKGDLAALEARILEEARIFIAQLSSAEAREAFTAFIEKRQPDFSGIA